MTQAALTHLNLLSCLNLPGAQQPGLCACTSLACTAQCLGVSSVSRTFAGGRGLWPLLFSPILLLVCHSLVFSCPKGLLVWLIFPEATLGGLGFPYATEGDKGGKEVQRVPHGCLVTSTSCALFLLLLFVYAFIGTQLQTGNGVGAPRVWRGCQSPQPPTPPAASPEQGNPTLSSSQLHNPPKYSERGACNSS